MQATTKKKRTQASERER